MVDIVILRKRIKRNTGQLRSQRRYSTTMASCMDRQCSTVLQQEDPFHRDRHQNKKRNLHSYRQEGGIVVWKGKIYWSNLS